MTRYLVLAVALTAACSKSDKKKAAPPPPPPTPEVKPTPPPPPPPVTPPPPAAGGYKIVTPDKLTWNPLMPGQPGPEMAVVKGDPMTGPATIFLRIPPKGDSGLHTHTASYRATLVSGSHTHWLAGEKDVKPLTPGGYWFQPGGQAHGDRCEGPDPCVLFIQLDGKFDFTPAPDVKTVDRGAYKLVRSEDMKFAFQDPKQTVGAKFAFYDGDPTKGPVAFGIQFDAPFSAGVHTHTSDYEAVVITGSPAHWVDGQPGADQPLPVGTYWFQPGKQFHGDTCLKDTCRLGLYMPGAPDFIPKP